MITFRFTRKLQLLLLIFVCLIGVDAATQETNQLQQEQKADEEDFKIKVDVDLVTTDVTVVGAPASEIEGG
jgi:hypothetical protein